MKDPKLPKQYQDETDYRKIPREYLETNIPQGRGSVKWQPFATIPEQYERINQHIEDQNKIDKPELSQAAINDLNNILIEKMFYNPNVNISYWKDGYILEIEGLIEKIDSHEQILILSEKETKNINYIDLNSIMEVN